VPEAGTVTDLLALDRPLVIAHAGGDFEAPHSTMYAFTEAALAGTDVLEMDVMLTADDVLVVHHDDTVDRTTETTGAVRDLTYAELAALDNAHWFVPGTWSDQSLPADAYELRGIRTGERPPPPGYGPDDFRIETFRAVAEAFPDHVLDVELKVQRTGGR
jgi:glycerophosphoryl diester phosphodiesterase